MVDFKDIARVSINDMKVGDRVIADTHWTRDRYQQGVIVALSPPGWVNYRNDEDGQVWSTDPSNIRITLSPAATSGVDAGRVTLFSALEAAYIRGAAWCAEMGMTHTFAELRKAAYDYADKEEKDVICREVSASLSPAATPVSEAGGERLLRQLRALAVALHAKHYATDAPDWQPLEDGEGILSQIDNMTTGLVRADPVKCNCVRETFAYYLAEAENGLCKIPRRAADDLLQSYVAMEAIVAALAKTATSPAGGDVHSHLVKRLNALVAKTGKDWRTGDEFIHGVHSQDIVDIIREAADALSAPSYGLTEAGRRALDGTIHQHDYAALNAIAEKRQDEADEQAARADSAEARALAAEAALAVERERCAKIAEAHDKLPCRSLLEGQRGEDYDCGQIDASTSIAAAIRAQG